MPGIGDNVTDSDALLQEIRGDLREVRRLLVGNGQIGLCEQMRHNTDTIGALAATVKAISETVSVVANGHAAHLTWHEMPENLTIQEMLRRRGIRFAVMAVAVLVVLFIGVFGVTGAYDILKGMWR